MRSTSCWEDISREKTTTDFSWTVAVMRAISSASVVLPIEGRAARIMRSAFCSPERVLSRSLNPVGRPRGRPFFRPYPEYHLNDHRLLQMQVPTHSPLLQSNSGEHIFFALFPHNAWRWCWRGLCSAFPPYTGCCRPAPVVFSLRVWWRGRAYRSVHSCARAPASTER